MEQDHAWVAADLPDLGVVHRGYQWPEDGIDPYELHHDELHDLYWAHGRPSRAFPADVRNPPGPHDAIMNGRSTLDRLEKLLIAADGRKLRVWPQTDRTPDIKPRIRVQPSQLILADPRASGRSGYLRLGLPNSYTAVKDAVYLSGLTGRPVLLARVISSESWW